MKIALVHDQLNEFGGAERVLLALAEMFPEAPIYTAFVRKHSLAWERFSHRDIRVSWAHYIPGFSTIFHSPLRFLAPLIWNSFDFRSYDLVISSSSWYVTKGFERKGAQTKELCYCHTPPRWLYGYETSAYWQRFRIVRVYAAVVGFFMRQYDFSAASRVNYFVANSHETARRIEKFYRRSSRVVYPPVLVSPFSSHRSVSHGGYYLVVSRLAQPKHVDWAIEAANMLRIPLKIVGVGKDISRLRAMAGDTVEFLGHVDDDTLSSLYAGAKAFLATATDEDFGLTPVEAMGHGVPVIGYRGGGYVESVIDGKTGILFDDASPQGLICAIQTFERTQKKWDTACRARAAFFGKARFEREIRACIDECAAKHTQ